MTLNKFHFSFLNSFFSVATINILSLHNPNSSSRNIRSRKFCPCLLFPYYEQLQFETFYAISLIRTCFHLSWMPSSICFVHWIVLILQDRCQNASIIETKLNPSLIAYITIYFFICEPITSAPSILLSLSTLTLNYFPNELKVSWKNVFVFLFFHKYITQCLAYYMRYTHKDIADVHKIKNGK